VRRIEDVSAPSSLAEAMAFLRRRPGAVPWAGGTALMTDPGTWDRPGGPSILDLGGIPELRGVTRSARYVELGAMVSLSAILALPRGIGLGMLRECCLSVGTAFTRAMATLGGNLCARHRFMSCTPVLSCMDAALELRDATGSRWSSVNRLVGEDGRPRFPEGSLLTRVRVPVARWSSWALRQMGEARYPHPGAAVFVGAARFEGGAIAELRIAAAGLRLVRDRSMEMSLIGRRLPLSRKESSTAGSSLAMKALELEADRDFAGLLESYTVSFLQRAPEEAL